MKRWPFAGVILAAAGIAQPLFAQTAAPANPVPVAVDENGKPIPRAVPVLPGDRGVPRAVPVARATPKPVKPADVSELDDPGTIRVAPSTSPKTADQIQLDIADGFYAKKMYEQAAPEYEKYLGLYPTGAGKPQALFRLGESYRHNGAFNAARNAYETLLAQFAEGDFIGPAAYRLGDIYYQQKQFRDAATLYRKASVRLKDPAVINAAKFYSGRALEAEGEKLDARMVYEDLVAAPENNPFRDASRLSLALLLKDAGRTAEALKQILALAKQTDDPELKMQATVRAGLWEGQLKPPQITQAEADFRAALAMPGASQWKELAQLELLKIQFDQGKFQQVIDAYVKEGAEFSADVKPDLLQLVGNSYRELGKGDDALKIYDQILKEFPATEFAKSAQYERLRVLYAKDDPNLIAEIDKYVAGNPEGEKRDVALLMKAEIFFKKQAYQDAMLIYSTLELSRQLPANRKAEVLFRLGWCQMQARDYDHAIKALTAFIEQYPGNSLTPYALIQRGMAYQSQKALGSALKDYENLIRNYPKAKERELALHQKALIQGQQENNTGMAESFRLLLKDYPETAARSEADYWIGWADSMAKNYKDAVSYLEEARKLNEKELWEKSSILLLSAQFNLEDKEGLAKEVDLYSKKGKIQVPAEMLRWLSREFEKSGDFKNAEKYLQLLMPRDEAVPDDFLFLGRVEHALGKYDEAVNALKKYLDAVKLPRPRAEGLLILANSQIAVKTLDAAQSSDDEALTLQPEGEVNGKARTVAGDIQYARGNFTEAAKLYESVAAILDNNEITPIALEKAVDAWTKAGDEARAKKTLNILKSRYPEYLQHKHTAKAP